MEKKSSILDAIKSLYILKNILLFLKPNVRCNLVKYNNQLKGMLQYSTDDYLKSSNYFIKNVKNRGIGNGTESMNTDNIIVFVGNYVNYQKDGLGIEFFSDGKKRFKGEYSKGKKVVERDMINIIIKY